MYGSSLRLRSMRLLAKQQRQMNSNVDKTPSVPVRQQEWKQNAEQKAAKLKRGTDLTNNQLSERRSKVNSEIVFIKLIY